MLSKKWTKYSLDWSDDKDIEWLCDHLNAAEETHLDAEEVGALLSAVRHYLSCQASEISAVSPDNPRRQATLRAEWKLIKMGDALLRSARKTTTRDGGEDK